MTLSTLTRWLRRSDGLPPEGKGLVDFHSLVLPEASGWAAEVQRSSGTVIRFQTSASRDLVEAVLRASR
jgi:hypothetical protein